MPKAKKARAKRPAARKPRNTKRARTRPGTPAPAAPPGSVSTGSGPSAAQIGADLVRLCNAGKLDAPCKEWWHDRIESVEADGQVWRGKSACAGKNAGWYSMFECLGARADGPYVGGLGFAVRFDVHVREKASGKEIRMSEIAYYTVKNGKIIREEFLSPSA